MANIVEVNGGTARQRELVESMANFVIKKLMPKMRSLDVTINIKKIANGAAKGYCCSIDKRTFELEIERGLKLRPLMETVAHEMVHVKQYAKGELTEESWQGKLINPKQEYWDHPWEIEAHGREVGLFIQWVQNEGAYHKPGNWMLYDE